MDHYYIATTKYSLRERQTQQGVVYDVIFRVVDIDGYTKQKSLCGYQTKALAKNAHKEFIARYCDLGVKPQPKVAPKRKTLLKEAVAQYLQTITGIVKDSTVYTLRHVFDVHILPDFGERELQKITKDDVQAWVDRFYHAKKPNGSPYNHRHIARTKAHFSTFYEWAGEKYGINNPVRAVKIKRTSYAEAEEEAKEIWTNEQFHKFLSVVEDPKYKALFATMFYFGCRKGEAVALSPKDYNGSKIRINKTFTNKTIDGSAWKITPRKQGKPYSAPVAAPLKEILDDYVATLPKDQPYMFGKRPPSPTTVQRRFEQYTRLANLPAINLHALRHSFASMCAHYGANPLVIANLIGDTPEQVMKTYAHLWDEDQRNVIAQIR